MNRLLDVALALGLALGCAGCVSDEYVSAGATVTVGQAERACFDAVQAADHPGGEFSLLPVIHYRAMNEAETKCMAAQGWQRR